MSAHLHPRVIVIGTGQAGFQLSVSLREAGHVGPITLVGEEPGLPYQRPPLSKTYLFDQSDADSVHLRGSGFYATRDISVRDGCRVVAIDRDKGEIELDDGHHLGYDQLVLATGTRARLMPVPGAGLDGVVRLRTLADAESLRARLREPRTVVIIGGGFIGMEIAAASATAGHRVTVVEGLPRPMARVVSPELSAHVTARHEAHGVRVLLGRTVTQIHGSGGRVTSVELESGENLDADVILIGIGVVANSELASAAGLEVCSTTGGIVVDEQLATTDPRISAIGDCATYPSLYAPTPVRLESVQNAVDHARHLAARLVGQAVGPYRAVPWFWTNQFDLKIQIAGLGGRDDTRVVCGDPGSGRFSVLRFDQDQLIAVESVNRAPDHIAARKLLAGDHRPTEAQASTNDFSLKTFASAFITS